jgi:hypothetical protein
MANVTIPHSGTEYTANAITLKRGLVTDIITVGVYHTNNPNTVPVVTDFITVLLVKPGDALADGSNLDILSKIGPRSGDVILAAGDWQRWCYVKTANEDILRKVDTITIT